MSNPPVVCISGCSSGLGLALAEQLACRGALVYAGLRNPKDAARLPPSVRPLALDVTCGEQIAAAMKTIEEQSGRLDMLINNAGINASGPWELTPADIIRRVFDVNLFGAIELTRAALPLMRRQGSGRIIMVSSLSGLVGLPADGVYAASKSALEAFAESLSYEVRRWNIRVNIVNPGAYATELMRRTWHPDRERAGPYGPLVAQLRERKSGGGGDSREAAAAILAAVEAAHAPLRIPLDDTGRRVFRTLRIDPQAHRDNLIRSASGLAWWIDGVPAPSGAHEAQGYVPPADGER